MKCFSYENIWWCWILIVQRWINTFRWAYPNSNWTVTHGIPKILKQMCIIRRQRLSDYLSLLSPVNQEKSKSPKFFNSPSFNWSFNLKSSSDFYFSSIIYVSHFHYSFHFNAIVCLKMKIIILWKTSEEEKMEWNEKKEKNEEKQIQLFLLWCNVEDLSCSW